MGNTLDILQRTNLRNLGRFLMEDRTTFEREAGEAFTEAQIRQFLEDDLRLALRHGGENPDVRFRAVLEETWEKGKMAGFMTGMRAGARIILSLTGERDPDLILLAKFGENCYHWLKIVAVS